MDFYGVIFQYLLLTSEGVRGVNTFYLGHVGHATKRVFALTSSDVNSIFGKLHHFTPLFHILMNCELILFYSVTQIQKFNES